MFTVYFSNRLDTLKEILTTILNSDPNPDPFKNETVLVQSLGMAQWLKMSLAEQNGIAGGIDFPFPTSFIWQQYRTVLPNLPKENIFRRSATVWRLLRIIPQHLDKPEFRALNTYLRYDDQFKRYQLADKIADLFDQYLVYRPHWLQAWEEDNFGVFEQEINGYALGDKSKQNLLETARWQGVLWKALLDDVRAQGIDEETFTTSHRLQLQSLYFEKLDKLTADEQQKLPSRIFVFGISSMPQAQLDVLKKLSQFSQIHLFFLNPNQDYWGDMREDKFFEKRALRQNLSEEELEDLLSTQFNPLLAMWGKQGRDFFDLLVETGEQLQNQNSAFKPSYEFFQPHQNNIYGEQGSLLNQLKNSILDFKRDPESKKPLPFSRVPDDHSIQIHACYSKLREVEVLHNRLLQMFEQDPNLTPKDIIVMSPDIDDYAPYIRAVFDQYAFSDSRYIPFALSDQKISQINPIFAGFLTLIGLRDAVLSAEQILELLEIDALRSRFAISEKDIPLLRQWIQDAGIRSGLHIEQGKWKNYNSWENGLDRLLLGSCLKEEHGAWENTLPFTESYGLIAAKAGLLAEFIEKLTAWQAFLQQPATLTQWQTEIGAMIKDFFDEQKDEKNALLALQQISDSLLGDIDESGFADPIDAEIIAGMFQSKLENTRSSLHFLTGKVNFCTLMPMRAIPFKTVCLLGMNEGAFPRPHTPNSFDLMQQLPKKADRSRRNDDQYLFLEALLSAQDTLYISYIGHSLTNNQAMLPSVLITQLQQFIDEQLPDESLPVIHHPMTVFSPKNFEKGMVSYNKEWAGLWKPQSQAQDFAAEPLHSESSDNGSFSVDLNDLIAFVQNPIQYFFNRRLGVYFSERDNSIDDAEPFTLSYLDQYRLNDELLAQDSDASGLILDNAVLKGEMTAANFAELEKNRLKQGIAPLQEKIAAYLHCEKQTAEIELTLPLPDGEIRLFGNIPNLFEITSHKEIVQWRAGKLGDKYKIKCWLYHLALCATAQPYPLTFYYKDKEKAESLQFPPLDQSAAQTLLQNYLTDYRSNQTAIQLVVYDNLTDYFKALEKQDNENVTAAALDGIANGNYGGDEYLRRLQAQTTAFDYTEIQARTTRWFKPMLDALNNDKDKKEKK